LQGIKSAMITKQCPWRMKIPWVMKSGVLFHQACTIG
jgi:hypothetical protein